MSRPKDLNNPSPWNMRIWDEAKHQWLCDGEDDVLPYYGFDIRGGEVTAMQSMDWVYRQFEHGRKLIWERSTGLTDKNGKEIYEGDIVQAVGEITLNDDIADNPIAEVVWVDSAAAFGEKFTIKEAPMVPFGMYTYEVIGNIHEPPKDFRPEHLKRMGVSISKGGEE